MITSKRSEKKFSEALLNKFKTSSLDGPQSKPEMVYELVTTFRTPDDVPEELHQHQGHCVLGLLLVTAVIRSWGRRLERRVARAMLVSPLARWKPIAVLRRVAMTAGPLPVRA
jgi:hypothetical protein